MAPSARLTAGLRAMELDRTDREPLVRDPYARALAGPEGLEAARRFADMKPEAVENILLRHRCFDRRLEALAREGFETAFLLGAGLDTRAYRLDACRDCEFYAVDRPEALAAREAAVREVLPGRDRVRGIPADLADVSLSDALEEAAGLEARSAVVVAEGLLCYLPPETGFRLLEQAVRLPVRLLALLFDVFDLTYDPLQEQNRRVLAEMRKGGEEVTGLYDAAEVEARLRAAGAKSIERTTARDEARSVLALDRDTAYHHYFTARR